jgi:hypothetical protein
MATDQPTLGSTPASAEYVLPPPPRPAGEVVVVAPRSELTAALRRGADAARALGERFGMLAESQAQFVAEVRQRLEALDAAVAEASRAQVKGVLRETFAVLDWCDAVHGELAREAAVAAGGALPIDVAELCADVALAAQTPGQPVYVQGRLPGPFWIRASQLAELVAAALELVAERTLGRGGRSVAIAAADGALRLTIRAVGEPADAVDPRSVARFRRAAQELRAVVRPDALGAGGTGLVVELPSAARE